MATMRPAVSSGTGNVFVVAIRINDQGKIETDPPTFEVSKGNFGQVLWKPDDPNLTFKVEFKGESPFADTEFSNANPYSGSVRRDVNPPKQYKYTVSVGNESHDPGGIVNP